ncbi:MAG: hypothetical protein KKD44_28730 [Proteobacteria bacterium]|nr:hypothetical protein [Pseudomonadota bacterium]
MGTIPTPYLNKIIGDGYIRVPNPEEPLGYEDIQICEWQIDDIVLDTEPEWLDKDKYSTYEGSLHPCIDGTTPMQIFERDLTGLPITLKWDGKRGALLTGTVDDLVTLMNAGDGFDFDDGSGAIECAFDYTKEYPVDFEYVDDNRVLMKGTVYLIRV